ncbi:MAG: helix-turn-helix transcriptional regulator [Chloroflexi bacterium]|nr:helix-turn-helix transcriptional regulator [Chloroflexota bacterium]
MNRQVQRADAAVARSQTWIAEHYDTPNPVAAMAEQAGLTRRTFARRFRSATGALPIEYVHGIRIDEAKGRLERSGAAIDDIGAEIGYEDPTFFRRLFKRKTGLTPAAYRRKYASIAGRDPVA